MKTSIRNKKGFTIVELVIVIAVIAILAAVLIPTFANLVEKANLSADEQAVKQMNTALKIYEAENGKPEGISTVKTALSESGINANIEPVSDGYAFYWDSGDNVIELVSVDDLKDKNVSSWTLLSSNNFGSLITPQSAKDIASALTSKTPVLIKLDSDLTVADVSNNITDVASKAKRVAYIVDEGETVIIDLNGQTLTSNETDYLFHVKSGGTLTIKNGTLTGKRAVDSRGGSVVSLENVTITAKDNTAVFAVGFADVSIVKCTITATSSNNDNYTAYYAVSSNSNSDANDGTKFYIDRSTLSGTHSGVYFPTNSDITIIGSKITGYYYGAHFAGCHAFIRDTSFSHTGSGDVNVKTVCDLLFQVGASGSGYATYGSYECENVTAAEVYKEVPNGATVVITGITVEIKDYPQD